MDCEVTAVHQSKWQVISNAFNWNSRVATKKSGICKYSPSTHDTWNIRKPVPTINGPWYNSRNWNCSSTRYSQEQSSNTTDTECLTDFTTKGEGAKMRPVRRFFFSSLTCEKNLFDVSVDTTLFCTINVLMCWYFYLTSVTWRTRKKMWVNNRKALTTKSSKITTKRSIASELWSITLVSCIIYGSARSHGELWWFRVKAFRSST